jgi:hypothetical protein
MVADGVSIVSRRNQESQNASQNSHFGKHLGRAMYHCGGLHEAAGDRQKASRC